MDETLKPKTKIETLMDFVRKHPKKIAAIIAVLVSSLSPDAQKMVQDILEALLQSQ